MNRIRFLHYILFLFLLPFAVFAQGRELSLQESIRIALDQNLQYRSAEKSLDITKSKMYESIGNFLPRIDASLIRNIDEKLMEVEMPPMGPGMPPTKIAIDFTKDYMAALQLQQPIFTGGALWFNYRQNYYNYKAEEQNYRKQKLATIFDVKKTYYGVLLSEELIKVSEEALHLSERLFKNTKLLYEQGLASKFQLLNAEVELENIKPKVLEAKNNCKLALLAFKNLLQLQSEDEIHLRRGLQFIERKFALDSLLSLAKNIRPDIQQMHFTQKRMDKLVDLSYSAFSPVLALAADYNYRRNQFDWDVNKWQDNYTINLVLSIPLFQGATRIFKIQQAKAARHQVDLAETAVNTGAALEIKKNYLNFHVAIEKHHSQQKNVERAEENVRIADLNYKEGLITSLEMSVAQMNLIETKIINLKTLSDYLISLAALEKSVGIENIN